MSLDDRDYMRRRKSDQLDRADVYYDPKIFRSKSDHLARRHAPSPGVNYGMLWGGGAGFVAGFLFACLAALKDWDIFRQGAILVLKGVAFFSAMD